jgi:hypothetical protein
MLHWCCMSGRITTIFVLFPMIDNLFVTCLVLSGGMTTIFVLFSIFDNLCLAHVVLSGRIATILVLLNIIDNLCLTGVVYLVGLRQFWYCSLWMLIYASLVLYVWSDIDYFCTVKYNWYFMPHWCCMSGRIPTIDVLFPMIDNLCFTDVECLVRLRLFLYCSLWLIIYVSLELYVWSDCDYFCTVPYDW